MRNSLFSASAAGLKAIDNIDAATTAHGAARHDMPFPVALTQASPDNSALSDAVIFLLQTHLKRLSVTRIFFSLVQRTQNVLNRPTATPSQQLTHNATANHRLVRALCSGLQSSESIVTAPLFCRGQRHRGLHSRNLRAPACNDTRGAHLGAAMARLRVYHGAQRRAQHATTPASDFAGRSSGTGGVGCLHGQSSDDIRGSECA